ncbi:SRPBCC domain-containing protein [Streptomyces sp. NPDC001922]|uniref:SRPBCC domain-containing protein n=1 Tax=Streptomyces sp. NPDC001922 TaxID=3364624 RepID=UPI0036948B75
MFVPFSAGTVRQVLVDPTRVAGCIPGFQEDADAAREPGAVVGRLRLRVANSTITYRGRLRVVPQDGGDLAVEGEGTEARGSGSVRCALTVRLIAGDGGTTLAWSGTVRSEGRLAEADDDAAGAAGRRLLDRFAVELAAALESSLGSGEGDDNQRVIPGIPSPENGARTRPDAEPEEGDAPASGFETDAREDDAEIDAAIEDGEEPPAEAAHARRTMIGRSAEEVDHAPPRGRYAPVPAPEAASTTATLRWAAPAAAALVASAVVVGRILRRRR